MSQTDIRNSNQYQQAPVKMRPPHSSAAEFSYPSRCRGSALDVADVVMSRFVCLSAESNPELSTFHPSPRKFYIFLAAPTSPSLSERSVEAVASNFPGAHVGARVGGCVSISPTAAPGLHLIRPLFLSCPNRQAL